MNHVIARTNTKGQFVIPIAMRKSWGISPTTNLNILNVPNVGIVIKPLKPKKALTNKEYLAILDKTQGAWAGDDWPKTEKQQRKLAIKEAKQMRQNSW